MTQNYYIGTYTSVGWGHGESGEGIYQVGLDTKSGRFTGSPILAEKLENASYLAVGDGFVYAVSELNGKDGELAAFRIQPDGSLEEVARRTTGGGAPCHVTVGPGWVAVANYMGGSMAWFPLTDGIPGEAVLLLQHGHGTDPQRQEAPHVHSTILAPDGHLIAADLGLDELAVFEIKPEGPVKVGTGKTPEGFGPRHMVFSPEGRTLYVICEMASRLCVFDYDNGKLRFREELSALPEDFTGWSASADLHLSPDGKRLYASNRGHDSITVFSLQDGRVTRDSIFPAGGRIPRGFALCDGRWLLCANQDTNNLCCLDALTGAQTDCVGVPSPVCVQKA